MQWDMYVHRVVVFLFLPLHETESTIDPSVLVGWHVDVHGRGRGLVKGIKKSFARPTKFIVHFENGSQKLLSLKRSDKKGKIPFTPISKM